MFFDVTKAGAAYSFAKGGKPVPEYKLCLEDIDELVASIFDIANRNPKVYLRFMKEDAKHYIAQENKWVP